MPREAVTILIADDDPEDRMLIQVALKKAKLATDIRWVENGEELLDYLYQRERYAEPNDAPRPDLVLLDLNMPRKNGFEALKEIKASPALRTIPIIILTTTQADTEIYRSYDLGASAFITKPVSFEGLVNAMQVLGTFWTEVVKLPREL
jgi:CheY-like chemotaxis protein